MQNYGPGEPAAGAKPCGATAQGTYPGAQPDLEARNPDPSPQMYTPCSRDAQRHNQGGYGTSQFAKGFPMWPPVSLQGEGPRIEKWGREAGQVGGSSLPQHWVQGSGLRAGSLQELGRVGAPSLWPQGERREPVTAFLGKECFLHPASCSPLQQPTCHRTAWPSLSHPRPWAWARLSEGSFPGSINPRELKGSSSHCQPEPKPRRSASRALVAPTQLPYQLSRVWAKVAGLTVAMRTRCCVLGWENSGENRQLSSEDPGPTQGEGGSQDAPTHAPSNPSCCPGGSCGQHQGPS